MAESLVLGIDSGGSKTALALATRDGDVAGCWRGGGTNPFDQPAWRERLAALFERVPAALDAAAAGLGGYRELADISTAQDAWFAQALRCPHTLHNDVQVAFDGAFQDRAGVLILAGTGSMAWAQADGRTLRVGGWGPGFGDEGSAYWIGQRAVGLTSQAIDLRLDAAGFADAVLTHLGLNSEPKELLGWFHGLKHPRSALAALAPCVSSLAARGEPVARGIMDQAAEHLCAHVAAAQARIGRHLPWSHAGGLFASRFLVESMTQRLGPSQPPLLPPLGGALWRAARLAGWAVGPAWTTRLAASLARRTPTLAESVSSP